MYNDKELNEEFGLDWLDYGARWYDPSIARWNAVDPLAEVIPNWTPFAYTFNNPILYNDPTGMMGTHYNWDTGRYEDEDGNEVSWEEVQKEYGIGEDGKDNLTLRKAKLTVTNKIVGKAYVSGYLHPSKGGIGRTDDQFEVPLYKMTLEGMDSNGKKQIREFEVIRFGVQQAKTGAPATVVGLRDEQTHVMKRWRSEYLEQDDGTYTGAWTVYGGWLLHEGADDPIKSAWGAVGCVEVCGNNQFERMNWLIRVFSGTKKQEEAAYQEIIRKGLLSIHYEKVKKRPPLIPVNN